MEVHDSFDLSARIDDDERRDLLFLHESKCGRGQGAAADSERMRVHDLACSVLQGVGAVAFEQTTKISVGDHAGETAVFKDGGHTELLARHLVDDLRHRGRACDLGEVLTGVHPPADACKAPADSASGVKVGKVFGLPSTAPAYLEGERVAE